jgi:predicted dinucleotide-binding enzyme
MAERALVNGMRRTLLAAALAAALPRALAQGRRMKIGVIGSGRVGGTIGRLWHKAGHEVMFSARDIAEVRPIAAELGKRAAAGTPREAAAFGEAVLISVPYAAVPQLGRDLAAELKGKVVLETGNPYAQRDGEMANAARDKGTGLASAEFLPGARLVRAFNSMSWTVFLNEAHRAGERVAIPLAADDAGAMQVAEQLVRDAGFEPVAVGPLARARDFDMGSKVFGLAVSARELRRELGLPN